MIRKRSANLARSAGLTLMELLISLALLAVIATGMTASIGFAVRLYDRSADLGRSSSHVAYRLRLRDWLTKAAPPSFLLPFPAPFKGTVDRLEFTTLAETPFAPDAAALKVEVARQEDDLVLNMTLLTDEGGALQQSVGVLAEEVSQVQFEYLPQGASLDGWVQSWPNGAELPDAIKITIASGSNPDWPDFIVRPVLGKAGQ